MVLRQVAIIDYDDDDDDGDNDSGEDDNNNDVDDDNDDDDDVDSDNDDDDDNNDDGGDDGDDNGDDDIFLITLILNDIAITNTFYAHTERQAYEHAYGICPVSHAYKQIHTFAQTYGKTRQAVTCPLRPTDRQTERHTHRQRKNDRERVVWYDLLWGHSRRSVPCDNGIRQCSSPPTSTGGRAGCTTDQRDPADNRRTRRPGCSNPLHTSEGIRCHTQLRNNLKINNYLSHN